MYFTTNPVIIHEYQKWQQQRTCEYDGKKCWHLLNQDDDSSCHKAKYMPALQVTKYWIAFSSFFLLRKEMFKYSETHIHTRTNLLSKYIASYAKIHNPWNSQTLLWGLKEILQNTELKYFKGSTNKNVPICTQNIQHKGLRTCYLL